VIFVFISIFLLNNHDENEYIILGLVFLLAFILSPRVGEMIQWIIAEIYTGNVNVVVVVVVAIFVLY